MPENDNELNQHKPPESAVSDAAHAIVRAGLSAIPVVGGAAVELFTAVVTPPLERRRNQWMREIGEALSRLEAELELDLDELQRNEVFIDTVLTASQIAMRSSQEEKRKMLRNAVLNSALPNPPEESRQQFFLYLIDIFTVWHLRLIKFFQDPQEWARSNNIQFPHHQMGSLSRILENAFPELQGQRTFYDQVWKDIFAHGLTNTENLHTTMTEQGLMARRASELGEEFLRFIEDPGIYADEED